MCSMRHLPDDVLGEMLRSVSPRNLAASRCVCTAWRELIDGRRLLRSDLLPHTLAGLLINYHELPLPDLFRRPSISTGNFRFSRHDHRYMPHRGHVRDHCNGIVLLSGGLLNPATGWWVPLRKFPSPHMGVGRARYFSDDMHLVFDPAVSPHCEVFLIPRVSHGSLDGVERATLESEWPPSLFVVHVFSTATGRWTERVLIRDGKAIETVAEMRLDERSDHPRLAVYWRGALYVRCEKDFTMRISLSENTYRVIKPPCGVELELSLWPACIYLARSEKGVYFAFFDEEGRLWVWVLDESCSQMEWVLKHSSFVGLKQPMQNYVAHHHVKGPWILENTNREKGEIFEAAAEQESEWNSDDDEDRDGNVAHYKDFGILAFHPYKEIVFLQESQWRGLAYHLNSSKLETLGDICPKYYSKWVMYRFIETCFPYTPCMIYGGGDAY